MGVAGTDPADGSVIRRLLVDYDRRQPPIFVERMMGRFSNLEFRTPAEFLKIEPLDEATCLKLADEHFRMARFEPALRCYTRAVEINPNAPAGWLGQARMLIELGEHGEATVWAGKGLEIFRDEPDLLSVKAVVAARQGDVPQALAFSDSALSQKGSSSYRWLARGEAPVCGGHANEEACFRKAAADACDDWFAWLNAARVCSHYGRFDRALAYAQQAVEREDAQPFAWHTLAECCTSLGLYGQAERAYRRALELELDAGFRPAVAGLAWVRRGWLVRSWERMFRFLRRNT